MNKTNNMSQTKFPYIVTALGVGLMAVSQVYSYVRAMMLRAMFQASGGSGLSSGRHFSGGFGTPSILTTIAVTIAIIGIVWLGLTLRKSAKSTKV